MAFEEKIKNRHIFGVDYTHLISDGDLFLTDFGRPFLEHLLPSNWNDQKYYEEHPDKKIILPGTGRPYKITTQPVDGETMDIVVKWCRVGQDTIVGRSPGVDFITDEELDNARWNGPFEEFGLLSEFRATNNFFEKKIHTQRPLAIFSPEEKVKLWQTGRDKHFFSYKNKALIESQDNQIDPIELDIQRLYAMIYLWVKGEGVGLSLQNLGREGEIADIVRKVYYEDLIGRGYRVPDTKPAHIIVRRDGNDILKDEKGNISYALIDFELLRRTKECDNIRRKNQRAKYWNIILKKDTPKKMPDDKELVNILGVDYVCGRASNGGRLWVVGKDPELFDYFDPIKWRWSPRRKLSLSTSRTKSADNIYLVYKESRMKMIPAAEPHSRVCMYGYNSPFEEVAIAYHLRKAGLQVVYPRAIYETSHESLPSEFLEDHSRIESHKNLMIDNKPILADDHDYYVLFGLWRGIDPLQDFKETGHWGLTDVVQAYETGMISKAEKEMIIKDTIERMKKVGFDRPMDEERFILYFEEGRLRLDEEGRYDVTICIDGNRAFRRGILNEEEYRKEENDLIQRLTLAGYEYISPRADQLLFNMDPDGVLKRDDNGFLQKALCNFELIKPPWFSMSYEKDSLR